MKTRLETIGASMFIAIGVIMVLCAIFQGYFHTEELSVFVETFSEKGIPELEAVGHDFTWLFISMTELIGGFFLASIGTKIIKK